MAFRLWIEETDKSVWHRATSRTAPLRYRAACGWELDSRPSRVWPQKPTEPGPPDEQRCHTCVAEEPAA